MSRADAHPDAVYRWSPEPMSHYVRPDGPNPRLLRLTPLEWNLAWVALPDPVHVSAPRGFLTAMRRSIKCVGEAGQRVFKLGQLLRAPPHGFPHVVKMIEWRERPPLLDMDPDWFDNWVLRIQDARPNHPSMLHAMMNYTADDVRAARIILTKMGLAQNFQD